MKIMWLSLHVVFNSVLCIPAHKVISKQLKTLSNNQIFVFVFLAQGMNGSIHGYTCSCIYAC